MLPVDVVKFDQEMVVQHVLGEWADRPNALHLIEQHQIGAPFSQWSTDMLVHLHVA